MSKRILVGAIVFVFIWICLFLQVSLINQFPLFGVSANIAIVVVVSIGLFANKIPGVLVGGTYGLLVDILFGKSIGVYFAIYAILGYICGALSNRFSKDNKMSTIYMTAIFTVIAELVTYLLFVIIYGYSLELFNVFFIIIKEVIYNVFIARILFKPLMFLGEIINKSKNSYYIL